MSALLEAVLAGGELSSERCVEVIDVLADPRTDPALGGALLGGLRAKGVSARELAALARAMRARAVRPALDDGPSLDVVGTGGDGQQSFNLSTGAALLLAAMGTRVVKHGNRSVSSRSGSADVLEALGLRQPLDPDEAISCLRATGFTFLFAPHYHPAMKAIAPVRRALGVRTTLNLLGPLTNPSAPRSAVVGAPDEAIAALLAGALGELDVERAVVVTGVGGWDEATPIGPFLRFDVRAGGVERSVVDPQSVGLARCSPDALVGGDADHNARHLRAVLDGSDRGAHADAIALNAALGLEVAGRVASLAEGVREARRALEGGVGAAWLETLVAFDRARRERS